MVAPLRANTASLPGPESLTDMTAPRHSDNEREKQNASNLPAGHLPRTQPQHGRATPVPPRGLANRVSVTFPPPWKSGKQADVIVVGGLTCVVCLFLLIFAEFHHIDRTIDQPVDTRFMYRNLLCGTTGACKAEDDQINGQGMHQGLILLETEISGIMGCIQRFHQELGRWPGRFAGSPGTRGNHPPRAPSVSSAGDEPNRLVTQLAFRLLGHPAAPPSD